MFFFFKKNSGLFSHPVWHFILCFFLTFENLFIFFSADDFTGDCFIECEGNTIQCVPCGKVLSDYKSAKRHYITTHLPAKSATCHICSKTYKNDQTVKAHMRGEHGISQKMIKCKQ